MNRYQPRAAVRPALTAPPLPRCGSRCTISRGSSAANVSAMLAVRSVDPSSTTRISQSHGRCCRCSHRVARVDPIRAASLYAGTTIDTLMGAGAIGYWRPATLPQAAYGGGNVRAMFSPSAATGC